MRGEGDGRAAALPRAAAKGKPVSRERRLGALVLAVALATVALMLGPLGDVPAGGPADEAEVGHESRER